MKQLSNKGGNITLEFSTAPMFMALHLDRESV